MAKVKLSVEQKILDIDNQIASIKKNADDKIKSLKEDKQKLLSKKNEKFLQIIQDSGLGKLSEDELKAVLSKLKV